MRRLRCLRPFLPLSLPWPGGIAATSGADTTPTPSAPTPASAAAAATQAAG